MVNVCRELPSKVHWCWIIVVFLVSQIIPKIHSSSMKQLFHRKKNCRNLIRDLKKVTRELNGMWETHLKTKSLKNNLYKENHLQIKFNFLQFVKFVPHSLWTIWRSHENRILSTWAITNHKDVERHWAWSTLSSGQTLE